MRAIGRLVRAAAAVLRSAAAPVVVLSLLPAVTVNRFAGTIPRSAGTIPAPQARDDRPWNRAYRDGLEQLKEGRFVEAERSFRRALAADRAPAERNRMVVFDNIGDRAWFLPEYYLAVTLLNQRGKDEEARPTRRAGDKRSRRPAHSDRARADRGRTAAGAADSTADAATSTAPGPAASTNPGAAASTDPGSATNAAPGTATNAAASAGGPARAAQAGACGTRRPPVSGCPRLRAKLRHIGDLHAAVLDHDDGLGACDLLRDFRDDRLLLLQI